MQKETREGVSCNSISSASIARPVEEHRTASFAKPVHRRLAQVVHQGFTGEIADDNRRLQRLVPAVDHLEKHQLLGIGPELPPDLIDDEKVRRSKGLVHLALVSIRLASVGLFDSLSDPRRSRIERRAAVLDQRLRDSYGKVRLARSGRAVEKQICTAVIGRCDGLQIQLEIR